jgi:hypothetical protein
VRCGLHGESGVSVECADAHEVVPFDLRRWCDVILDRVRKPEQEEVDLPREDPVVRHALSEACDSFVDVGAVHVVEANHASSSILVIALT